MKDEKEKTVDTPQTVPTEEKKVDTPPTPKVEEPKDEGTPAPKEPVKQAPNEDPVRFNLRQQLREAQDAKNDSIDPEEKSYWAKRMDEVRGQLSEHDTSKKKEEPTKTVDPEPLKEDEEKAVKENLKKLGFASKDELLAEATKIVEAKIASSKAIENQQAHERAIASVYAKRPDILADKELRQDIEKYVINNYRVEPTTPPAKIAEWLQTTIDRFVPSKQTDPEALKKAQDKVDLFNVDGGQKPTNTQQKGSQRDRDFLKAKGWSEEKINRFYS